MKVAIFVFAILACAVAHPAGGSDQDAPIVAQDAEVGFDGTYHHSFESGNGISVQEQGVLKNAGNKDTEAEEISGSFKYTAPDGTPISVQYIANEEGFQPQGAHLPVGPEIPAAIARSLEWIAAHPYQEKP